MRTSSLLFTLLLAASTLVHAESSYFKIDELRRSDDVKEQAARSVKLYWGDEKTPEFAELAPPDVYTRSSISLSMFGGSKRHCVEAFTLALTALVDDALARGYDAIVNIRPAVNGKPSADAAGFNCSPGYKTTEVPLFGTFAMTQAALDRVTAAEQQASTQASRPAAKGALFLPMAPMLASPQAKSVLGTIEAYAGIQAPGYGLRYGPEEFEGEADIQTSGREAACQQAVVKALGSMAEMAKEKGLDMIIKVRSHLDEQYAPVPSDVECAVGKKVASVLLSASLAKRR
jgi:uncharacterized protein YbjQ (UPF0145 family)